MGNLYRTKRTVAEVIEEMEIEYEDGDLEDLEQCSHCSVWWYSYELIPDEDGNNVCKFCGSYYGW